MRFLILTCSILFTTSLYAQFDPDEYLQETYVEQNEVEIANVKVTITHVRKDGIDFVEFRTGKNALLVEKLKFEQVKDVPDDVRVECSITGPGSKKTKATTTKEHRIRIDRQVTKELRLDAQVANTIIRDACSGMVKGYVWNPDLTIGVTWEAGTEKRPRRNKVFMNILKPAVGFGSEF